MSRLFDSEIDESSGATPPAKMLTAPERRAPVVRSRFQFKLTFLVALAIAVSVVAAFCAGPSVVTFAALLATCCGLLLFYFPQYRDQPALVGGAAGVATVSVLVGASVLSVVIEAPIVQGELYDEDGPKMFFLTAVIAWFFLSFLGALFGMFLGGVIGVLVALVDPATSMQDR